MQTYGHVPEEKQRIGGKGVVVGKEPFDGCNQIIEDTDEEQGNDQVIPQLFPEHLGIALYLAQET